MWGYSSSDVKRYRMGYPGEPDRLDQTKNVEFYSGKCRSKPDGDYIDTIHEKWFGNYSLLERHHGYIQWLFPIREEGMNFHSQKLQPHEAKTIQETPEMKNRVIKSYEMMLDFYGMKLVNQETGEVSRSDNYKKRYRNLNHSFHNYLRITRILKCLGELGLEHYKMPFVEHVLNEIFEHDNLRNCYDSCVRFWVQILKNDEERDKIMEMIEQKKDKLKKVSRNWYMDSSSSDEDEKKEKKSQEKEKESQDNEKEPVASASKALE